MRVLTVTNMYPSPARPVCGSFVKAQVDSLRELGVDVQVLFVDTGASKFNYLRGAREVAARLASGPYDLIHVHFGLCGLWTSWQSHCPVVISCGGGDIMHPLTRPISQWVARRADAVIVKSEQLKHALGVSQAHVIPNGVDLSMFRPMEQTEARRRLGLDADTLYVAFVGDYVGKLKGFDLVTEAVGMAGRSLSHKRIELLPVYGEPHEMIPLYMNAADVLALASKWEGSPNVVKEAMACNLPVVIVDVGDARERLDGEIGCHIVDRTPESFARGLEAVLSRRQRTSSRDRMGPLSSEAVANRVLGVYEEVLRGEKGPECSEDRPERGQQ
tara:strand:+ start:3734 stop:4723 length:990 start_codon:yes stop_codon:yes gene_type:complete